MADYALLADVRAHFEAAAAYDKQNLPGEANKRRGKAHRALLAFLRATDEWKLLASRGYRPGTGAIVFPPRTDHKVKPDEQAAMESLRLQCCRMPAPSVTVEGVRYPENPIIGPGA